MDLNAEILSGLIIFNKYARFLPEKGRRETWSEIVDRNKAMHIKKFPKLQEEIEQAYTLVYEKKVLPSARSLQFAGRPIELFNSRLFNCSYMPANSPEFFSELMFLLLGGSGVGFSVQFHHVEKLPIIIKPRKEKRFIIQDSIIGWSDAVKVLIKAYFTGGSIPCFDFGDIRPKGTPLKTSGGIAPGPEPLKDCLHNIQKILDRKETGDKLSPIEVHDIACFIGDAVLAGGIRRAALISLFSFDDEEMLSAKAGKWYELNSQRGRANNSAVILRHKINKKEFLNFWNRIKNSQSGEPGYFLTNDQNSYGVNPCAEASLREFTFCNLCDINVADVESQEDLNQRAKAAAFIGTLQASYTDFHYLREIWKTNTEKDSLLGVGLTGIATKQVLKLDLEAAANVVKVENARVAKLINIREAARTTVVKPSGTTSLVLGTSSGIHAYHGKYFIRRVRLNKTDSLYNYMVKTFPKLVEDDYFKPTIEAIISIPQRAPDGAVTREESALDLLERTTYIYKNWILPGHRRGHNTHNVSTTVTIKDSEWEEVGEWMWHNRENYTALSTMRFDLGSYVQTPLEEIDEELFNQLTTQLKEIDLTRVDENTDNTNFKEQLACTGGVCEIV